MYIYMYVYIYIYVHIYIQVVPVIGAIRERFRRGRDRSLKSLNIA
jgi:hypothetical protein